MSHVLFSDEVGGLSRLYSADDDAGLVADQYTQQE